METTEVSQTIATFEWARTLKSTRFQPLQRISYQATPKFPHDSHGHDCELLAAHFGCEVAELSDWHYNGRSYRLTDGREGRLDAAPHRIFS